MPGPPAASGPFHLVGPATPFTSTTDLRDFQVRISSNGITADIVPNNRHTLHPTSTATAPPAASADGAAPNRSAPAASVELSPAQHALSGGTAGVVSRFLIAPFDVIKIHLQLQTGRPTWSTPRGAATVAPPSATGTYEGIAQFVTRILREEGVRGLWKGNLAAEYLYLTYGAAQFLAYSQYKQYLQSLRVRGQPLSPSVTSFTSGLLTGITATTLTYPFDLLRTRFAAQSPTKQVYSGILNSVHKIYQSEGIMGFYRGVWPSLVQVMPYISLVFGTYDLCSRWFQQATDTQPALRPLAAFQDVICGGLAGTVSKAAVFPLDVVRKRLQ
ncbi:mitochondrial thiamine pyrophosphate transporter, partial [Tieghemiomyces parasiticus]